MHEGGDGAIGAHGVADGVERDRVRRSCGAEGVVSSELDMLILLRGVARDV